jgi:hypothetical protein
MDWKCLRYIYIFYIYIFTTVIFYKLAPGGICRDASHLNLANLIESKGMYLWMTPLCADLSLPKSYFLRFGSK